MAPKIDPSKLQREQVADRIVNLSSHEMQLNVLQQHSAVPKTNVSQRIQVEVLLQIERLSGAERPVTKGRKKKAFTVYTTLVRTQSFQNMRKWHCTNVQMYVYS